MHAVRQTLSLRRHGGHISVSSIQANNVVHPYGPDITIRLSGARIAIRPRDTHTTFTRTTNHPHH